ncbi:hypothetical protein KAR91_67645 [Candidatus Pacearchaeota archaeon]|nr:hypothetical protein [Candidatus Pacearchaeota archaeon]
MKNVFIILGLILTIFVNSQTVTIPTNKTKIDSVLYEMTYNSVIDGTFSNPLISSGNTVYNVDKLSWKPDKTELQLILNNGGSVNQTELVLKLPQSSIEVFINTELPDTSIMGNTGLETRRYNSWFNSSGKWTYNSYVYCLTKNHKGVILNGLQINFIISLSGSVELMGQSDNEFIEAKQNGIHD